MRDCVSSEFPQWFFNYIFRIYIEKKKKKKTFFDIPTVICIVFIEDFPLFFCLFG